MRVDEPALRDAADLPAGTVTLRSDGGAEDVIAHPAAVSFGRVLELAGVAPAAMSFASVQRPNGSLLVLRPPELAPAPLVWLDADSVRFLRPVRDDADVNAADNIATASEDLLVRVRQGPLLDVAVRIAPERPRAGERVRLEARVGGSAPGATLDVRWRFGDGTEASGAAVRHRWRRAGSYAVVASAEGDDDSGGASEPVVVVVDKPRERPGPGGGGDRDPDRAPASGPSEAPAPSPPAVDEPADSAPAAPSPPTADEPEDGGAAPARTTEPTGKPDRRKRPPPEPAQEQPAGVPVRGVLVAATMPAAQPGTTALPGARRGTLPDSRHATLALGGLVAAALLAFGAWRERRRPS